MFIASSNLQAVAEQLLGRALSAADGIDPTVIADAENRLHIVLPEALKQFYLLIGGLALFTDSFERIVTPRDLAVQDRRLIFAEENQDVCIWGADLSTGEVFMFSNQQWHPENLPLSQFLILLLFYNCAQGGYAFAGTCGADSFTAIQKELAVGWRKEVVHNGLTIYAKKDSLIWFFHDATGKPTENIFLSSRTERGFDELSEKLNFIPL